MKTLSRTFKLTTFATIGAFIILSWQTFAGCPPGEPGPDKATFVLKIKKPTVVNDENTFSDVFDKLGSSALYCVHMKHSAGHTGHGPYAGKTEYDIKNPPRDSSKLDIKTDKVIISDVAKAADGALTPIQVHTTKQVASQTKADITKVLYALQ
jgi:hypothetical protein